MNRIAALAISLAPLAAQDPVAMLERARTVNLERAKNLPEFIADETVVRYKSPHTNPPKWEYLDTFEAEIAVQGGADFTRRRVRMNGRPFDKSGFPGFNWSVWFGVELGPLFNGKCDTRIEFDKREEVKGRPAMAYRFRWPEDCFGTFTVSRGFFGISRTKSHTPPWSGRFLVDEAGNLIRFESQVTELPKDLGADPLSQSVTWDYVKIADEVHLLPVAMEIFGGFTRGDLWHAVVEYKNHRQFKASTNITFQDK